jgi:hypothetical protein
MDEAKATYIEIQNAMNKNPQCFTEDDRNKIISNAQFFGK